MSTDEDAAECLMSAKGSDYKGTANITESGYTCQAWGSQSPNTHGYGENYCRNIKNKESRPWCYTTSTSKIWEYCNIPLCGT